MFLSSYRNTSGSLLKRTRNAVGTRAADECFHSFFRKREGQDGEATFFIFYNIRKQPLENKRVDWLKIVCFNQSLEFNSRCFSNVNRFASSFV